MPSFLCTARSSSPSFFAAQRNAPTTTANVRTEQAAITTPRNVLMPAAYVPRARQPLVAVTSASLATYTDEMTQRFEQIYADHREAVRAYVRRRAPDALVDDVVSETFVVCLRRIDRVPPQPLPWLYAVAWNTLANERRKQARVPDSNELPVDEPGPVGDGVLATAFNSLNERDREVLRLVAWEGLSLTDAATVLGCSGVACRVRYHRAKARLKSRLEAAGSFRPQPREVTR